MIKFQAHRFRGENVLPSFLFVADSKLTVCPDNGKQRGIIQELLMTGIFEANQILCNKCNAVIPYHIRIGIASLGKQGHYSPQATSEEPIDQPATGFTKMIFHSYVYLIR